MIISSLPPVMPIYYAVLDPHLEQLLPKNPKGIA